MNRLQQLQNRQATLYASLEEISSKVAEEDRDLTDDEKASITKLNAELAKVEDKDTGIPYEEKRLAAHKLALASGKSIPVGIGDGGEQTLTDKEITRIRSKSLAGQLKAYKGEDAKLNAYKAGQFVLATIGRSDHARLWCQEHGVQLAQSEGTNIYGGYLVPDQMSSAMIDLREQYGVFRRFADIQPMSAETLLIPRRTGGLTVYAVSEGAAITDSTMTFDQIQLVAQKFGALTYWSTEVNEDTLINWVDKLTFEMGYAFSVKEDQCGFIGDGTGTYNGIVGIQTKINDSSGATYAGSIQAAASGNTAFSTLDLDDFENVVGKLPQYATGNAKWYISKPGWAASMLRLEMAAGGNTSQNISAGGDAMFLGYPVVWSQVLNSTLGADVSAIKCLFGDLSLASSLGDRRGISIAVSDQVRFTQDQLAIKGTTRYDIKTHDIGDATNAGPIVALKTPAS